MSWFFVDLRSLDLENFKLAIRMGDRSLEDWEKSVVDSFLDGCIDTYKVAAALEAIKEVKRERQVGSFDNTSTLEAKTEAPESTETGDLEAGRAVASPENEV